MGKLPTPDACRSCGASIFWATTEAGKFSPVDAEPHPEGTVVLRLVRGRLRSRIVPVGELLAPGEQRRRSHWATCPTAASHRKEAPAPAPMPADAAGGVSR